MIVLELDNYGIEKYAGKLIVGVQIIILNRVIDKA